MRKKIFLIAFVFIALVIGISANLYSKRQTNKDNRIFNTKDIAPDIKGFGGHIEMLVTLNKNDSIKDVKILNHNETSEYADGITKPEFLSQFKGKTVNDSFIIDEDVDAVTGATISSKAVAETLKTCLERISKKGEAESKDELLTWLETAGLEPQEARYYKVIK